jgi:hypothetical protein
MLKNLRRQKGLTATKVARDTGFTRSRLGELEAGSWRHLTEEDFDRLVRQLRPTEHERHQLLVQYTMTGVSSSSYSSIVHHGVDLKQIEILERERTARRIRVFEPFIVPGPLQTGEYTRSVFLGLGIPESQAAAAGSVRAARRDLLTDGSIQFDFVVGETGLYTQPGGPTVAREQLRFLMGTQNLPNVRLSVIPTSAGVPLSATNAFTVIDESYVTAETTLSEQQTEDPDSIGSYLGVFRDLEQRAVLFPALANILARAIEFYSGPRT